MKFDFNWPSGFVRKLCFDMLMGRQYERPWLKGQIYQVRIITGFNSIKKVNFSKKFPIQMH